MTPDQLVNIFNFFQLSLIFKLILIVLSLIYLVFSLVVYRQVVLMTQELETGVSPVVKTLALAQIIAGAILVFLAITVA